MNSTKTTSNKQILSNIPSSEIIFLNCKKSTTKELIVEDIINQIKEESVLDLGAYSNIEGFKTDILQKMFCPEKTTTLPDIEIYRTEIINIINKTIDICYKYLQTNQEIRIFILPTNDTEAVLDLDGVDGFALGKNSIYILINPSIENWRESLSYTVPHEYAHLISMINFEWNTILSGIVFEGLAEHLREFLLGGTHAKYSIAITEESSLTNLDNLSESDLELIITDENYDIYLSYFFGTKNFPNWYGYSLGYWLIKNVLETTQITLNQLFNISPKEILNIYRNKKSNY